MRLFLNIFLIAFFIDSGFSVISSLLVTFADSTILSGSQQLFGLVVFIFSLIIFFSAGINASIPKKQILPLILFLVWATMSAPPLPVFFENHTLYMMLSFIQLFISLATFWIIRRKNGSRFFTDSLIPEFSFSFKNTSIFFGVNLIIVPVLILFVAFTSIQALLNHKTAGFLRLSPSGIYMKERIYQKDDKTIKLIGMIHIGEGSYYDSLTETIQNSSSILMAEGVSDKNKLIKNGFSTKGFAKTYGLRSQEDLDLDGELISYEEFNSEVFSSENNNLKIVQADVDISSFSSDTIEFLNIAGKYVFKEDSFAQGLAEYNTWIQKNGTPELIANIKNDIIDKRNEKVISMLETAVEKFSLVIVPWGAMHMPAIEESVKKMGFIIVKTNERRSMVFSADRIKKFLTGSSSPPAQEAVLE